jgi:hypothetical protein
MDVKSLEAILSDFVYARPRFNVLLFAAFAGLGLLLALFGIYGVISHAVAPSRRARSAFESPSGPVWGGWSG